MAIHLLVDANLSPTLTSLLRERLSDVRVDDASALGFRTASDETILEAARERGAILLTEDRGFDLARNPICTHPGIIVIPRALVFPETIAAHLRRIWLSGHRRLLDHALTRLEPAAVRITGLAGDVLLVVHGQRLRRTVPSSP